MEIALIVIGGIVVITVVTMVGDYLTKTKLAQLSNDPQVVQRLEQRIEQLEKRLSDQDAKMTLLENDVAFTTKLLQDPSRSAPGS